MPLQDDELLQSGFTRKDIEKIKSHQARGDSQDTVLKELSNHFRALTWIAAGMMVVILLTIIFGSVTHVISIVIASFFLLIILVCVMPVGLGYKSWKLRRSHFTNSDYR